jgi:diguanylate cyclase (GGDEF)-like protein
MSGLLRRAHSNEHGSGETARRRTADRVRPVPRTFHAYTAVVCTLAVGAIAGFSLADGWQVAADDATFWTFAALVLAGELLPIQVPRGYTYDRVTVSTGFAFALLIAFGPAPAMAVYAVASLIADRLDPTAWVKALFNAGQYVLSLAAAAGTLALLGAGPIPSVTSDLGPIALAAVAFFAANHVLAGVGAALLTDEPPLPYLARDLAMQVWTAGFQLGLSPLVVLAAHESLWLVGFAVVPLLAIYLGGRQAAANQYLASHDTLTDLPNRWALDHLLEMGISRATSEGGRLALMLVDLDDFKSINDTLGHHQGDLVIEQVADRLASTMREGDVLARLGGDEFGVLLPGLEAPEAALGVSERVLAVFEQPFRVQQLRIDVSARIGIAVAPDHGETTRDLLRNADLALQKAKQSGSPHWLFAPVRDAPLIDRLAFASALREGIADEQLYLDYQPKVAFGEGGMSEAEALVRWQHPTLGVLAPDAFVPTAEQTGLIKALTGFVLDAAIAQAKRWEQSGLRTRVSVNVSARNLLDRELPATVAELLARHGLPAELLELEVTETKTPADLQRTRSVLEELRQLGVVIAIDDFGTGFSSLTQLQELPVDEIKIDKSFVRNMVSSENDAAIVRSTVVLGKSLHLAVTAEGVETEETWRRVEELGCDSAQGFLLGRPAPPEECGRRLRHFAQGAVVGRDGRGVRARAPVGGSRR